MSTKRHLPLALKNDPMVHLEADRLELETMEKQDIIIKIYNKELIAANGNKAKQKLALDKCIARQRKLVSTWNRAVNGMKQGVNFLTNGNTNESNVISA